MLWILLTVFRAHSTRTLMPDTSTAEDEGGCVKSGGLNCKASSTILVTSTSAVLFFTMMLSHSLSAVANGICRTSGLLFRVSSGSTIADAADGADGVFGK